MIDIKKEKLIFGTYQIEDCEIMEKAIFAAGETGFNLVDTAWIYRNEEYVGKAIKKYNESHDSKLLIQTKIWPTHFCDAYNQALKQFEALGVEQVFSLLLHRIPVNLDDAVAAWKDLIRLKKEGKVAHIGVSNFDQDDIKYLVKQTGVLPEVNQIEFSIVNYREDRQVHNEEEGITLQAWTPLGKDLLATKTKTTLALAKKYDSTPAQIAIAYLLNRGLNVVTKSGNPDHIKSNFLALKLNLNDQDIEALKKENKYIVRAPERMDI